MEKAEEKTMKKLYLLLLFMEAPYFSWSNKAPFVKTTRPFSWQLRRRHDILKIRYCMYNCSAISQIVNNKYSRLSRRVPLHFHKSKWNLRLLLLLPLFIYYFYHRQKGKKLAIPTTYKMSALWHFIARWNFNTLRQEKI